MPPSLPGYSSIYTYIYCKGCGIGSCDAGAEWRKVFLGKVSFVLFRFGFKGVWGCSIHCFVIVWHMNGHHSNRTLSHTHSFGRKSIAAHHISRAGGCALKAYATHTHTHTRGGRWVTRVAKLRIWNWLGTAYSGMVGGIRPEGKEVTIICCRRGKGQKGQR